MNAKNGKIVVFSGTGISAASGIATFRDGNGLWANHDPMVVCNYRNWRENYALVHDFYNKRRMELADTEPNEAHKIVSRLQAEFDVINITQNVDDLFERVGCKNTLHLHGNLRRLRCEKCKNIMEIGYKAYDFSPCPSCGEKILKPDIVFFFEPVPAYADLYRIFSNVCDDDIVVVIGTSGEVVDICSMLGYGYKILNNLESARNIDENMFDSVYLESSVSALPKIYDEILRLKAR